FRRSLQPRTSARRESPETHTEPNETPLIRAKITIRKLTSPLPLRTIRDRFINDNRGRLVMRNERAIFTLGLTCLVLLSLTTIHSLGQDSQVIQGSSLEEFLSKAKIMRLADIGTGVTLPKKATLELDGVTRYAVFKTIDESAKTKQLDRGIEFEFQDS